MVHSLQPKTYTTFSVKCFVYVCVHIDDILNLDRNLPTFDVTMTEDLQDALASWTSAVAAAEQSISAVCEGHPADTAKLKELRMAVDAARLQCELIMSHCNSVAPKLKPLSTTASEGRRRPESA